MSRDVKESVEEKYIELESEMRKGRVEFESLKLRFKELESEKSIVEEELIEQMMVNKALEFEKQVAENEAEAWKIKYEKLVERVQKLGVSRDGVFELGEDVKKTEFCNVTQEALSREGLVCHRRSGSPDIATPVKDCVLERSRGNMSSRRRVKKMLSFEDDGSKPAGVVDLCDKETEERSEKELDAREGSEKESDASDDRSISENYDDEDVEFSEVNANTSAPLLGRKRKLVIPSDSENDDDDDDDDVNDDDDEDNIPIAVRKKLKPPTEEMSDTPSTGQRRVSARLRKQKVIEESSTSSEENDERLVGVPTTGKVEEDDEIDGESERESESMNEFIVDDDSHETGSETSDESGVEESDEKIDYADTISRFRRGKNPEKKRKWEYETDMLADFGKDPELCMRAVCTLYRFQTEDEAAGRFYTGRGFNKLDAPRGCRIGDFLTDGDPEGGQLKKTVEELKNFECKAVEICRDLAYKYSKQIFKTYKNREDPFFASPPSP